MSTASDCLSSEHLSPHPHFAHLHTDPEPIVACTSSQPARPLRPPPQQLHLLLNSCCSHELTAAARTHRCTRRRPSGAQPIGTARGVLLSWRAPLAAAAATCRFSILWWWVIDLCMVNAAKDTSHVHTSTLLHRNASACRVHVCSLAVLRCLTASLERTCRQEIAARSQQHTARLAWRCCC